MMLNQTSQTSPFSGLEKIKAVLKKDPKRSGLMGGLAVIMLVLWGRMLLSGPASATASFIRRSVSVMTNSPEAMPRPQASTPVLEWLARPKQPVNRNLFTIHLDYYARAGDHVANADVDPDSTTNPTEQTDQKREKQILLENLQSQASKLKLQTTLMGSSPKAMINGELVKEGDIIGGFVVGRIEARRVEITQDGVVLEIVMP